MKGTKELKTNKGITLIALVITIIVMLILVAVTISMAVNGGLFEKAGEAVQETNTKMQQEQLLSEGRVKVGEFWYDSIDDYMQGDPSAKQDFEYEENFTVSSTTREDVGYKGIEKETLVIPEYIKDNEGNWHRVTEIDQNAFKGCTDLTNVNLPNSMTYIHASAFENCTNLTNVNIPNGVDCVDTSAFAYTKLTEVTIPDSVGDIGAYAFAYCTELEIVNLPDEGLWVFAAFRGCSKLKSCRLPDGQPRIYASTFEGCSALKHVYIPASVTKIEAKAFLQCNSLTDVYFGGTQEQWNAISVADNNTPLTTATIHYGA